MDSPSGSMSRADHEPVAADLFLLDEQGNLMIKKLIGLTLVLASTLALAHGGGTNSQGCHHERSSGGYHCH